MNEAMDEFYENIVERMRSMDEDAIWNIDDVAAYLKLQVSTARRKMRQKGAPRPCRYNKDRWPAKRVKEWASRA